VLHPTFEYSVLASLQRGKKIEASKDFQVAVGVRQRHHVDDSYHSGGPIDPKPGVEYYWPEHASLVQE
jgi:hypothetical protein